ncbi:universal stress protein [Pseudomarimonas salicorniae]|uniref:Universal stress protein n=1 Tax=Pseudomarimonas salicorniae TaxID=2933270 RepID=A0ABT0GG69_9GAMM|nr:universal stress protein [Lysobacter sp. CAU 1642]MCK7593443.1 universal stress protein [Lysobacter sp. CAU 1642]
MSHPLIHAAGHVCAAIDASVYADSVTRLAAWAAQRTGAPLDLLHVIDRNPEAATAAAVDFSGNLALGARELLLEELTRLDEQRGKLAQKQGRALLERAAACAREAGSEPREQRLLHGSLVETLTGIEPEVRLFVIGKRGEHADFAKGHLGGNLERVVRAVHRPVLVAAREFRPIRHVMIAFDGSPTTRRCVEMVAASPLFESLQLSLLLVGAASSENSAHLDWAERTLQQAGLAPRCLRLEGNVEEVIARRVREDSVDLLVMGAYGHSRIRQLIIGSATTTMLRTCLVPVLLLR